MTVYLVGAGPGDPGLITVKGAALLRRCDVVVYDRLSAPSLLDLVPASAERIFVGKGPGQPSVPQEQINELLLAHGRRGATVVRLKGGDPFVFARGGEEVAALVAAGIPVEVVPGITSAIAAPAYAGIAVTRRYSSTSLTIVTGHEDPTKSRTDVDWEALAKVGGTIVVLMGVANLPAISARLIAGGLSAETPAAAVRWGTRPDQHTTRSTLGALHTRDLRAPSVIVIGDVAGDDLGWLAPKPLTGVSVVVTRAPEQASRLTDELLAKGADVVNLPVIAIEEAADGGTAMRDAVGRVADYDWVVLTSPNGAERFLAELRDARRLGSTRIAVIGPGTNSVLRRHLLEADLVPERYVAEGLLESFASVEPLSGSAVVGAAGGPRGSVLIAQAAGARPVLANGLVDQGWDVDVVEAYRTVPVAAEPSVVRRVESADVVAFASSSAVVNFCAAVPAEQRPAAAVAIGPITAATAREHGFTVLTASTHDIDGLVAAIVLRSSGTQDPPGD